MATISLCSLNSRLDLLDSCIHLLKSTWPHCRADRLRRLAFQEKNGLPCSLILIQHGENVPDKVIGHVRLVTVTKPDTPKSVYSESGCVDKSWQAMGYGKGSMHLVERYAAVTLGTRRLFLSASESMRGFFEDLSYKEYHGPSFETIGANLLISYDEAYSWEGNQPQWLGDGVLVMAVQFCQKRLNKR